MAPQAPQTEAEQINAQLRRQEQVEREKARVLTDGSTIFSDRDLLDRDGAAKRAVDADNRNRSGVNGRDAGVITRQTVRAIRYGVIPGIDSALHALDRWNPMSGRKAKDQQQKQKDAAESENTWYFGKEIPLDGGKIGVSTYRNALDNTNGMRDNERRERTLSTAFSSVKIFAGKAGEPTPLEYAFQEARTLEQEIRTQKDPTARIVVRDGEYILRLNGGRREEKLGGAITQEHADIDREKFIALQKEASKYKTDPTKSDAKTLEKNAAREKLEKEYYASSPAMARADALCESLRRIGNALPEKSAIPPVVALQKPAKVPEPVRTPEPQKPEVAKSFPTSVVKVKDSIQVKVMQEDPAKPGNLIQSPVAKEMKDFLASVPSLSAQNQGELLKLLASPQLKDTAGGKGEAPMLEGVTLRKSKKEVELSFIVNPAGEKASLTFRYVSTNPSAQTAADKAAITKNNQDFGKSIEALKPKLGFEAF